MNRVDTSNMGRCIVCGKPIDMRDDDANLVLMEQHEIEHPEFDRQDANEAIADALRTIGGSENHAIADAYESGEEIKMHEECHEESDMDSLYAGSEWDDADFGEASK